MKLVFQPLLSLHSANIKPLSARVLRNNMQCVLTIGRLAIQSIPMLAASRNDPAECIAWELKELSDVSFVTCCLFHAIPRIRAYPLYTLRRLQNFPFDLRPSDLFQGCRYVKHLLASISVLCYFFTLSRIVSSIICYLRVTV